jgi:hypothetical protein
MYSRYLTVKALSYSESGTTNLGKGGIDREVKGERNLNSLA